MCVYIYDGMSWDPRGERCQVKVTPAGSGRRRERPPACWRWRNEGDSHPPVREYTHSRPHLPTPLRDISSPWDLVTLTVFTSCPPFLRPAETATARLGPEAISGHCNTVWYIGEVCSRSWQFYSVSPFSCFKVIQDPGPLCQGMPQVPWHG